MINPWFCELLVNKFSLYLGIRDLMYSLGLKDGDVVLWLQENVRII